VFFKIKLVAYSFLIIFFGLIGIVNSTTIAYDDTIKKLFSQLEQTNTDTFFLDNLSYTSPIKLSNNEFFYLMGINHHQFVSINQLKKGIRHLAKKNRFHTITVSVKQHPQGQHIHIQLHAQWIIKKVHFTGIWFGKHAYKNQYQQQSGDVFDSTIHEDSIAHIRNYLHENGRFTSTVHDQLHYQKKNKTISVFVKINPGPRFKIKQTSIEWKHCSKIPSIHQQLEKQLRTSTLHASYKKSLVTRFAKKIRTTLQKQGYLHAQVTMKRIIDHQKYNLKLILSVDPGRKINLDFTGNNIFSQQTLQSLFINADQPHWLLQPDIMTEQLLHKYYTKGYWDTNISYTTTQNNTYFAITEGHPTYLEHVHILDAQKNRQPTIERFFNHLIKRSINQQKLQKAQNDALQYFLSKGFWDFHIESVQYIQNHKNNVTALITIDKGVQYLFDGFCIEGYQEIELHSFFKRYRHARTNNHIPFNNTWLQQQKKYILLHFQKQGFWYVTVKPQLTIKHSQDDVAHVFTTWSISPGPCVTFGPIILRGNTKLPFEKIQRYVTFKKGDLWNKQQLELTRKKLRKLDIFKQIKLHPTQLANDKQEKPIVLTLVDDNPAELLIRFGYYLTNKNFLFKRQSTPKGGATLSIKNMSNNADNAMFNFDITRFEREINIDYHRPGIFGWPVIATVKGYANKYLHPVDIGSSKSAYEAEQNGALFGISKEYKDNYFWGITVGNEWMRISRVRGNLKLNPNLIDKYVPYLFVESSLILDSRDNKLFTTSGSYSFVSLKLMIPEGHGDITGKLMLEQAGFIPLSNRLVFAGRIRLGHIFRRKFENILPIERFYLGGPYSLRGYEKDAVPPLGKSIITQPDGCQNIEYTIQGGSSMINSNLELRFKTFKDLWLVGFHDVGVLSQSGFVGSGNWFAGSGFGLRYKTPIGAFRFDIGWKWKRSIKQEARHAWYLTLGEAF